LVNMEEDSGNDDVTQALTCTYLESNLIKFY
jgi:hypothetical protein